ncbi:MerR family transcriptional regulator [Muricoccus radiodurans]|uniref:MerR family transcriptional regulator n=1 Tax=Muricoccus radiodurans TaxID=2231721 RepID=UPI003CF52E18
MSAQVLNPSEAAQRLGVSAKALRLYEERGLLCPVRTEAGWRAYGPQEMSRAVQIVALRGLGFSLAQVMRVLGGHHEGLEAALAEHQAALESRVRETASTVERVRRLRGDIAQGRPPAIGELAQLMEPAAEPVAVFELPWPWDGERFALRTIRAINFIIGPLGSGKTRFARRLAEELPGAAFLGLDRLTEGGDAVTLRMVADPALAARVEAALAWLVEDGASATDALLALLVDLEDGSDALVVDMVEQGLGEATQLALIAWLRRRGPLGRTLFLMTRSSAILDLAELRTDEAIIFCPANHSPPVQVAPYPGSPGYEAVATCLSPPAVRSRTDGMMAYLPGAG